MSVLALATLGGLISFLSTSLGAVLSFFSSRVAQTPRFSLSIDFALGLMVSASAFTLIGPAAFSASSVGLGSEHILMAVLVGAAFVYILKSGVELVQSNPQIKISHLLLATTLMIHNFPEGLASGAALAGLGWKASLPILGGISLQNVPEGALMVICLRALGIPMSYAFLGGLGSGLVELAGGTIAGLLISSINGILPLLLSAAGGAMITSVLCELMEGEVKFADRVWSRQFAAGLICLPLIQYLGT